MSMFLPIRSVIMAAAPRYWTAAPNLIPAVLCKSMPVMWPSVPLPGKPAGELVRVYLRIVYDFA